MRAEHVFGKSSEELTLSWLTAALKSSVGKKCVMGATGLFLCFFLVVHLAGNLLLFVGAESYNHYAHALHANPLVIRGAEFFLYAAFLAHIYLAITSSAENNAARGQEYAVKRTKRTDRRFNILGWTPDTTMFVTGAVVLAFLILHLYDFSWVWLKSAEFQKLEPYDKAVYLMGDAARGVAYFIGVLFLGIHVGHGLQSAFQSLGWNHPLFRPLIKKLSVVFAFLVTIGFGSFVLWGWSKAGEVRLSDSAEVAPAAPDEEVSTEAGHSHPHPHPEPEQR